MTKKAASVTNHHFHARGREFHDTDFNVNRPLFECCVDSFFELIEKLEHSRIQERQYLRHDDARDVLDRVDPVISIKYSRPRHTIGAAAAPNWFSIEHKAQ